MRLATRTFWWSFVPYTVLLVASFFAVRVSVMRAVRNGLRISARENQEAIARERNKSDTRTARVLRAVTENPALKAGVQLMLTERRDREQARSTVEDQLAEIGSTLGFEVLGVFDNEGALLAAVMNRGGRLAPLDLIQVTSGRAPKMGFFAANGSLYRVTSIPIDQGAESLGSLSVGDRFDLAALATPAVLTHNGWILESNVKSADPAEIESALAACAPMAECEVKLRGESFLSLPIGTPAEGYALRSLQSVDAAGASVQAALRDVFLIAGVISLLATLGLSALSSASIVKPISALVQHLRTSERTGVLPEFGAELGGDKQGRIQEIRELAENFNRAAGSIREGREKLVRAYVEFTGSLANALDARDPYTAGHSRRVSEFACAIGRAMNLPDDEMEVVGIGALLHDLGKIGISDSVLLKPGRLTPEENALIQEHPVIGRRILEGVQGFQAYIGVVELHHENWDGTGYPRGLRGEETPLAARIVKVADAYDAMTTDRPYRRGMSHDQASRIFRETVGTQMDGAVVAAFASLPPETLRPAQEPVPAMALSSSLESLAAAVNGKIPVPEVMEGA